MIDNEITDNAEKRVKMIIKIVSHILKANLKITNIKKIIETLSNRVWSGKIIKIIIGKNENIIINTFL